MMLRMEVLDQWYIYNRLIDILRGGISWIFQNVECDDKMIYHHFRDEICLVFRIIIDSARKRSMKTQTTSTDTAPFQQ